MFARSGCSAPAASPTGLTPRNKAPGNFDRRTVIRRETYLDWNATAPLRPEAAAAIAGALAQGGNPSSVHRHGRAARQLVEQSRERVAALAGAPTAGVVFTSGGTEANHLALLSS